MRFAMYRTWVRNAPSPRAKDCYQAFLARLLRSSLNATSCTTLMQSWLREVEQLRESRLSPTEQIWVSSELVRAYAHLRRTSGAIGMAREWQPRELSEWFQYRKYRFLVELDPNGGSRAWASKLTVASEADAPYACYFEVAVTAGARQHLPGNVFMSLIEEARRIVDELSEGQLKISLVPRELPAKMHRRGKRAPARI